MNKKEPMGSWFAEGILLSLMLGGDGILATWKPNHILDGACALLTFALIIWVGVKYFRLRQKRKQA